jgi:hypothetical protein
VSVLLLVAAGALAGFGAGIVAGRWAWLALVVLTLVIYVSIGTGDDVPPDWMATAVPVVPFAFIGVGIGIGVRRALLERPTRDSGALSPLRRGTAASGQRPSVSDLAEALAVLSRMLALDFDGADAYRRQSDMAIVTRHAAGYSIAVDRARVAAAPFDPARPGAWLPVEATGPGSLRIRIRSFEGYLAELELLDAVRFPDPATLRIAPT